MTLKFFPQFFPILTKTHLFTNLHHKILLIPLGASSTPIRKSVKETEYYIIFPSEMVKCLSLTQSLIHSHCIRVLKKS